MLPLVHLSRFQLVFLYNSNIYFMVNFDVMCVHFASPLIFLLVPLQGLWQMTVCLLTSLLNGFTSVTIHSHEETEIDSLFAANVFSSF